jgi:GNAT superfamily N-acetyltransferase
MAEDITPILRIKLKDLNAMAARFIDGAKPGTFIPITKHRAEALVHNPFADQDDVAMLLAEKDGCCLGYFGVMPVMLEHEGELHKVHWLTTWAVDPSLVGKGLGSRLMEEALALNVDLVIVGSKPARRVSQKYGFHEVKPLDYVQIDLGIAGKYNPVSMLLRGLRKLGSMLSIRLSIDKVSRPFEKFFEFIFGPIVRFFLLAIIDCRLRRHVPYMRIERASPGVKPAKPELPLRERTGFYRDSRVVNWMISYPWVLWESISAKLTYMFTDIREIEIFAWQVSDPKGTNLGYIAFQCTRLRNRRVLKVLDHDLLEETPEMLLALAVQTARYCKASVIEGSADLGKPIENSTIGRLSIVHRQRTCQVHPRSPDSIMAKAWRQIEQDYCDGDMAFT